MTLDIFELESSIIHCSLSIKHNIQEYKTQILIIGYSFSKYRYHENVFILIIP